SRRRRSWLLLGIMAILAMLAYFKYTGLVVEVLNLLRPPQAHFQAPSILLPLGISFYTFECLSYLIDVSQRTRPVESFSRFLLFPLCWPHLVAGPILLIKEFMPQLEPFRDASLGESILAVDRILIGVFKKVVIADSLAPIIDQGFGGSGPGPSGLDGW